MQNILVVIGALFLLISAVPYLKDVIAGKTRPRIVSWLTWSLLGAIATVAAFAEGHYPSAALTLAATIETSLIVIFGWRYGDRRFERFDIWCQVAAVAGLGLWYLFQSPLIGLTAALVIDIVAALPTLRHAWLKPNEETAKAYFLGASAAVCTLAALSSMAIMGMLYPLYLLLLNCLIGSILLARRSHTGFKKDMQLVPVPITVNNGQ